MSDTVVEAPPAEAPVPERLSGETVECFVSKRRVPIEETVEIERGGKKVRVHRSYVKF